MIDKITNKARSVLNLKRIFSAEVFFSAVRDGIETRFIEKPEPGKILVLAPHPDDESIGCGGALIKHIANKDQVKIIFLTNGELGFEKNFKPSTEEKKNLAKIREAEASQACRFLGVEDQTYLRYHDSKLEGSKSLNNFLVQTLRDYKPDIIYIPSILEPPSDHSICGKILIEALDSLDINPKIIQYEIWAPLFANLYLNIDDVIDKKIELIKIYKTQIKARNFIDSIRGLACYRGMIYGKSKYAEAFFISNTKTLKKLIELLD